MPAINPNNYNIDFFNTYSFGDITDNNYLTYLFQQNLPDIAPELIDSPAGNFQDIYDTERGLEKTIDYTSITNPGSIDEWLLGANFPVSLFDVAYQNPQQNVQTNQYGPSTLQTAQIGLENPDLIVEDTGFVEYPTSTGGGVGLNILTEGLDAVGLGGLNSFLIDFDSPLNDIAKERRIAEAKNRIKDGLIENTVGRINLDPLNLLTNGVGKDSIFLKDYKITVPADGFLGQAANLVSDVLGLEGLKNIIGGDLPDGAFDWDAPLDSPFSPNTIDITQKLLERTGKGTQDLLLKSLEQNKYGPIVEGQSQPLGNEQKKANDANQPTQKTGYLAFGEKIKASKDDDEAFDTSFLDNLGGGSGTGPSAAGGGVEYRKNLNSSARNRASNLGSLDEVLIDGGRNQARTSRPDIPVAPTESEDPTLEYAITEKLKFQGFEYSPFGVESDFTYDNILTAWNDGHKYQWDQLFYFIAPGTTRGPEPNPGPPGTNEGAEPNAYYRGELYWKDGVTDPNVLPSRGLLKYTQDLVNKATNVSGTAARFIGLPNSDQNYDTEGNDRRHITMSQGNLVKETKENKYYCRSWSTRNAYNTYTDLIRYSELWRENQPGLNTKGIGGKGTVDPNRRLGQFSTLRSPGIPKIAWEYDDTMETKINRLAGGLRKRVVEQKHVIPYMFSIENLAWKDSPQQSLLPPCEQGPFGGRIMWFPPYNINFTDNTSVNWDTTTFIGRAEPIYTYNNTERTGTLSWTIVVDHPSVLNKLKEGAFSTTRTNPETGEEETISTAANLETYFAGCSTDEIKQIVREAYKEFIPREREVIEDFEEVTVEEFKEIEVPYIKDSLSFHFKNATTSTTKEEDEPTDGYFDPTIVTDSGCPDGIVGRCFDYNYESKRVSVLDNPKLYKGGLSDNIWINYVGGTGECAEDDKKLWFGETEEIDLEVITDPKKYLPCNGKNFKKYGPSTSVVNKIKNGTASEADTKKLWSKNGAGYGGENYCCKLTLSGATIGGTDYKPDQVGFKFERNGSNERFWGVGAYPIFFNATGEGGASPVLPLTLPDGRDWEFTVSGKVPDGLTLQPGTGVSQLIEFLATTSLGKHYSITIIGSASFAATASYNQTLSTDRANAVIKWFKEQMILAEPDEGVKLDLEGAEDIYLFKESDDIVNTCGRYSVLGKGSDEAKKLLEGSGVGNNNLDTSEGEFTVTPFAFHPNDYQNQSQAEYRRVRILLQPKGSAECYKPAYDEYKKVQQDKVDNINAEGRAEVKRKRDVQKAEEDRERQKALNLAKNFINECDYFAKIEETDSFLYDNLKQKLKNFHPAFHSITPEGFNSRINFLQQCGRQGPSFIDPEQPQNTAFGRPPVCILRLGDFYYTKIIIDSINFTFDPLQWDLNPEGVGVQPMLVNVDLNFKFIGGSTLQGPLTQLQNAVSYNFFANTALYMPLEKILKTRSDGELVDSTGGDNDKTFYYGPWAGPQLYQEAVEVPPVSEQIPNIESENKAQEEDDREGVASDSASEEFYKSIPGCEKAILLTDEQKNSRIEAGGDLVPENIRNNPEKWNAYRCQDAEPAENANKTLFRKKEFDINQTEEELQEKAKTEAEEGTEEEQDTGFNQTTKDGQPIFRETASLRYENGEKYKNDAGFIQINGNYMDVERIGTSGRFSSNIDPQTSLTPDIGKILPQWVYGGLNNDIASSWSVNITSQRFTVDLEGSSGAGGGSNEAVVWDSNWNQKEQNSEAYNFDDLYNTCCTVDANNIPSTQDGKKLFAFNILENITGYYNWDEWKEAYNSGDDFIIEEMQEVINNIGYVSWTTSWFIQVDENSTLSSGESRQSQGGIIKVGGQINQEGLNQIIKLLTD